MSEENEKFKTVLPPLSLLNDKDKKSLIGQLKKLNFYPDKKKAA